MGLYAGRFVQAAFSAIKVPLLLFAATSICLPSFYVIHAVLGIAHAFPMAIARRPVCAGGRSPSRSLPSPHWCLFVYRSGVSYSTAVVANGVAFAIGALAGQWMFSRHYRDLVVRDRRHRWTRLAWLVLLRLRRDSVRVGSCGRSSASPISPPHSFVKMPGRTRTWK